MKKSVIPFFLAAMAMLFSSCFKDSCRHTYSIYLPVYQTLTELRAKVKSSSATPVVNAGKLFTVGNWIFLNEQNKGIHVIDNSNPSRPANKAFIDIPGNIDMYVKGNILYADLYCDMLAVDISNPAQIKPAKYLTNIFPDKSAYTTAANPDSIKIITDWIKRDTTVDCDVYRSWGSCAYCNGFALAPQPTNDAFKAAANGKAGSMARFAVNDNYLYAVTTRDLNVIDISAAANPVFVQKKSIGWDIETIFPYNNKLYIGAGSNMSVYDLQDPLNPSVLSWTGHWCSHDPVIVDNNYAYVTLHEANVCNDKVNQLEVYNITGNLSPMLVKTYPLTHPLGLSKDGDLLFVCDDGLKIFNVADAANPKLLQHVTGPTTYDVIAQNGVALVVAKEGLYQYDYSSINNIRLISKL